MLLVSSGAAAAGTSVLAFTDDIKASYDTVERSGRVAQALFVCINEYATELFQYGVDRQAADLIKATEPR